MHIFHPLVHPNNSPKSKNSADKYKAKVFSELKPYCILNNCHIKIDSETTEPSFLQTNVNLTNFN